MNGPSSKMSFFIQSFKVVEWEENIDDLHVYYRATCMLYASVTLDDKFNGKYLISH